MTLHILQRNSIDEMSESKVATKMIKADDDTTQAIVDIVLNEELDIVHMETIFVQGDGLIDTVSALMNNIDNLSQEVKALIEQNYCV